MAPIGVFNYIYVSKESLIFNRKPFQRFRMNWDMTLRCTSSRKPTQQTYLRICSASIEMWHSWLSINVKTFPTSKPKHMLWWQCFSLKLLTKSFCQRFLRRNHRGMTVMTLCAHSSNTTKLRIANEPCALRTFRAQLMQNEFIIKLSTSH